MHEGITQNEQITAAQTGKNPAALLQMRSGFVIMSRSQFLPGYCLLLGFPQVNTLTDLPLKQRTEFLADMSLVGEAVEKVCQPKRINFAILGNLDPFLHAHIVPRYDWEPAALQPLPIWRYPDATWQDSQYLFSSEHHGKLQQGLKETLMSLINSM